MKFHVGVPVGGPSTFQAGQDADNPLAAAILATEGVTSVFWTADFVTVSKDAGGEWAKITPSVTETLERHFS
jgi:hypothetical protein